MRQFALALLAAAPLLSLGCTKNSNDASTNVNGEERLAPPLYKNVPGAVTGNRAGGINSSFRIVQAAGGVPSDLYGGACIVFRAKDLKYTAMAGKQCSRDEDCNTGEAKAHYCQHGTKQCWARPDPVGGTDPYCNRSIDYHPTPKQWQSDTDIAISEKPIPVPQHLEANAQALTITLLKRKAPANAPPVTEMGAPTPIP